jgi:hypothetical protein
MNEQYAEYILAPAAAAHFTDRFEAGRNLRDWTNDTDLGRQMSALLADRSELERGVISTFLPSGLDESQLQEFKAGRNVDSRLTESWLAALIHSYVSDGLNRLAIFEEALGSASDPWIRGIDLPHFVVGNDICLFVSGNGDDHRLERILDRASTAWPGALGILTEAPWFNPPTLGEVIELSTLARLVASADRIVVGAYDGEGYLVWSRS